MSVIYVQHGDQKLGPLTTEELEGKVATGELSAEDLFWSEGMKEWQPLASVIRMEAADPTPDADGSGPLAEGEETPEQAETTDSPEEGRAGILHQIAGATVTTHAVHLECGEVVPLEEIQKVGVQTETIRRFKPAAGCVLVGVLAVCLIFIPPPRTTSTHWVIWGLVLVALLFWWVRLLVNVFRTGSSMVVMDLKDGDERIIRSAHPPEAEELREAIALALTK